MYDDDIEGRESTSMSELTHVSRPSSFEDALPLRLPLFGLESVFWLVLVLSSSGC